MTPRQQEVFDLQQEGKSERQIAKALGISRRTVRSHMVRIDPAIKEAMDSFGLDTIPSQVWLKNKGYSVQVRPQKENLVEKIRRAFNDIPAAPQIEGPLFCLKDMMTVYPFFDVHLGLRAHAEISGEEMNLELGVKRVLNAMSAAMAGAPASHKAVILNGGDFTHQTDDMNRTRRSGHVLDVDGRNIFTVREAIEVISSCIEMALTKHEVVEYYSVPGNHDPQNWETIIIGLSERYREHNRVAISFSVMEFSVVEHGEVALFIHHGDKRTPKDLSMYCAARFPEVWGRTRFRVLITGHLHHLKADEFPGIYWWQMPAITAPDAHAAGGYLSHSLMKAITFDRNRCSAPTFLSST